jgi:hypothetical protein
MLATLFEACLAVDEKIRQEKNVRARSFTKLFLSNSLNDVHFLCIKQFEDTAQGFFKNLSIPDHLHLVPTGASESMKVVNYILKRVSVSEETNSSPNSSNITPLETNATDPNQIKMYKSYLQDRVASKNPESKQSASKSFDAESGKAVHSNLFQYQAQDLSDEMFRNGFTMNPNDQERSESLAAHDQIQQDSDEALHDADNREPAAGGKMFELFKKSTSAKREQKSESSSQSSSNEPNEATNSMNDQYPLI